MLGLRWFLARLSGVAGRRGVLLALGLLVVSLPRAARALEVSELEERCVRRALGPHPDIDDAPESKRIERVEIVRLPVFDEDDPVPDFVNLFHAQSRERTIRRELLFREGDRYDAQLVAETLRNLQLLPQFGVVVVTALKGSEPSQVRVVVIVRDVWSLRLNYDVQGGGSSLNYLFVNLSEDNFLGTRTRLGGLFTLQPDRYSLGALVAHPRIAGSKLDAAAQGRVFVNLDSGKAEGSTGAVALYRDLLALSDKWAFVVGAGWLNEQTRVFSDRVLYLTPSGIPLAYHTTLARGGVEVIRSFGTALKFNVTWGVELNRRSYRATPRAIDAPQAYATFVRDDLPVSDTRLSPFVMLEHKTSRFLATRDVETLALQESFSLGQAALLRLYPAARRLGSSRDVLGAIAWVGYTWPWDGGLLRVIGNSNIEVAGEDRHQASFQAAVRAVSPRLGPLRLVADAAVSSAYRNYLNKKLALGGDTRPRGYRSSSLRGSSGGAATLELRTSSINVLSARVGAVAFYDLGGAGDSLDALRLKQSLGAGLRILFPQLNRQAFRLDWAAPLTAPAQPLPGGFYFTFGQAFDLPKIKAPTLLGAETTLLEPSL